MSTFNTMLFNGSHICDSDRIKNRKMRLKREMLRYFACFYSYAAQWPDKDSECVSARSLSEINSKCLPLWFLRWMLALNKNAEVHKCSLVYLNGNSVTVTVIVNREYLRNRFCLCQFYFRQCAISTESCNKCTRKEHVIDLCELYLDVFFLRKIVFLKKMCFCSPIWLR